MWLDSCVFPYFIHQRGLIILKKEAKLHAPAALYPEKGSQYPLHSRLGGKVKFALEEAMKEQRGGIGIVLLFL